MPYLFEDNLIDLFHGMYRAWTVENLLCRPRDCLSFCNVTRQKLRVPEMPDVDICEILLNARKQSKTKKRSEL